MDDNLLNRLVMHILRTSCENTKDLMRTFGSQGEGRRVTTNLIKNILCKKWFEGFFQIKIKLSKDMNYTLAFKRINNIDLVNHTASKLPEKLKSKICVGM